MVDQVVAFRSDNRYVLDAVDAFLGTGAADVEPTIVFDVREERSGELVLAALTERRAATVPELLHQATMAMNEVAVATTTCVTMHAGGVRSPSGDVVLLPAPSGSGKSTLTAALVARGWDYLSDETIGVRRSTCVAVGYPKPLALSTSSRVAVGLPPSDVEDVSPSELRSGVKRLSGDVGPVDRVVLPSWVDGAETSLMTLDPAEALIALLANTLNLAHVGQSGLDALCDLAEKVPVERLVYDDLGDAADLLRTEHV